MDMADTPTEQYIRNATLVERFHAVGVRAPPAGNCPHGPLLSRLMQSAGLIEMLRQVRRIVEYAIGTGTIGFVETVSA
jgi:hypothetical protein